MPTPLKKRIRLHNRWRKWTFEDDESLKNCYLQRINDIEIAHKFGRSTATITNRLRDLLQPNHKENRNTRVSWEISELIPSHESSLRGGLRGCKLLIPSYPNGCSARLLYPASSPRGTCCISSSIVQGPSPNLVMLLAIIGSE
jgi:hypothetical protein